MTTGPGVTIGVVGGTGPAGSAIAARLADRGRWVLLGSRDPARAEARVDQLSDRWGDRMRTLTPASNAEAATADVVFLAPHWEATVATAHQLAEQLTGKVVVSMANALRRHGQAFECIVPLAGSLAVEVQQAAPRASVVAALQHVPAGQLADLGRRVGADVLIAGDRPEAVARVAAIVAEIPDLRPVPVGPLANAAGIEAITAALLTVNIRTRSHSTVQLVGA